MHKALRNDIFFMNFELVIWLNLLCMWLDIKSTAISKMTKKLTDEYFLLYTSNDNNCFP